jgi:hypothetical protein
VLGGLLILPWAASYLLHKAGIQVDFAPMLGEQPQRRAITVGDEGPGTYDIPPAWLDYVYLKAYPDVAAAVRDGGFSSGYEHYVRSGKAEGREPAFAQNAPPRKQKHAVKPAAAPVAAPAAVDPPSPPAVVAQAIPDPAQVPPPPASVAPSSSAPPPGPGPEIEPHMPPPSPAPTPASSPPAPMIVVAPARPPEPAEKPKPPPLTPPPAAKTDAAAVVDVRLGRHDGFTRLVLDLTGRVDHRIETSPDGRSVTVDLAQVRWSTARSRSGVGMLVAGYDAKPFGVSGVRLTLSMSAPATPLRTTLLPPSDGKGPRLLIDLGPKKR